MNSLIRTSIFGVLALSLAYPFPGNAQTTLDGVVATWLTQSCSVGDTGNIKAELVQSGVSAQPALIDAAENGPPSSDIASRQEAAGRAYDETEAWIAANGAQSGISAADIANVQAVTREQFIADKVGNFTNTYRKGAIVGLGLVADTTGLNIIQSFATSGDVQLQKVAHEVLGNYFRTFSARADTVGGTSPGFKVKGKFSLRKDGSIINPAKDNVILKVGTFVGVIEPGSFVATRKGGYSFNGSVTGVSQEAVDTKIHITGRDEGEYAFSIVGDGIDLTGLPKPIPIELVIGSNIGSTALGLSD